MYPYSLVMFRGGRSVICLAILILGQRDTTGNDLTRCNVLIVRLECMGMIAKRPVFSVSECRCVA